MKKCILFGADIRHSLSPTIYGVFAAHYGIPLVYEARSVDAASLPNEVAKVAAAGYTGCNLTNPLKQVLVNQVRWGDDLTARLQTANVLHFLPASPPVAWNTDGSGFIADIARYSSCAGRRVLLLGSGGIVGPLAYYLHAAGASLMIAARNKSRLQTSMQGVVDDIPLLECAAVSGTVDMVVNATSVGLELLQDQLPGLSWSGVAFYYDCRYGLVAEPSLQWALSRGVLQVYSGVGMLVRQAAHAFSIWTGYMPDHTVMEEAERRCQWR